MESKSERKAPGSSVRDLSVDEWRIVLNDVMNNVKIDETLKKIDFTRLDFAWYLNQRPEKSMEYHQTCIDACMFFENDLSTAHRRMDPKEAKIFSDNIKARLAFLKPEKYGNKLDLNVNQTVSIKDNIEKANERLKEMMRDVTPVILEKK